MPHDEWAECPNCGKNHGDKIKLKKISDIGITVQNRNLGVVPVGYRSEKKKLTNTNVVLDMVYLIVV